MGVTSKSKSDPLSEFRSEFRINQILAAARQVFANKGYQDATMDEIAEVAGIAKGTLYSYFPSKREIYVAELSNGAADLLQLTRAAIEGPGDLKAKITHFIRTKMEYLDSHLEFFKIYQS